jgi:hypothetical protein
MRGLLMLVALGLTAGCGEPPNCSPGPPPVYVNVVGSNLAPGTVVEVCGPRLGCATGTSHDGGFETLGFPRHPAPRAMDGVVVTGRSGDRVGHATLRFHDGGSGPCTYDYATAVLRLGPGTAEVDPHTLGG